jgi:surfeit locus 1 family protein
MRKIIGFILFIFIFATLLFLGYWQLNRLEWKKNIITQLNAEYIKDPSQNIFDITHLKSLNDNDIKYGQVEGKFDYSKQMLFGPKPLNGEIGYWVITPLQLSKGGNIFVHRGWIGIEDKNNIQNTGLSKNTKVIGIFRKPDWNKFTPDNSVSNNVWSKLDINQMASAKGTKGIAPVLLYAEKISNQADKLILNEQRWYPRNKHKQYAIFWFGMAGVFLVIFGLIILPRKKYNS